MERKWKGNGTVEIGNVMVENEDGAVTKESLHAKIFLLRTNIFKIIKNNQIFLCLKSCIVEWFFL